jgi:AraC-like DNA-binding protein
MILRDVLPSPALQEYIRKHQIIRFKFGSEVAVPAKVYSPRPEQCLMFYLRDLSNITYSSLDQLKKHPKCTINGMHTFSTIRHVTRDFWALQIVFQPGAMFRLTGIPSFELSNTFIDAEAVWSSDIKQAYEQMTNCDDVDKSIKIAEAFLEKIIKKSKNTLHGIDTIGQIILNQEIPKSMDYFADQSCLSVRQFHRKFTERNGISPKSFDRITRFDRAFRMKTANPT